MFKTIKHGFTKMVIPPKTITNYKYFYLFILATFHGLQDLRSPTRDQSGRIAVKTWSPNHWTIRELPTKHIFSTDN